MLSTCIWGTGHETDSTIFIFKILTTVPKFKDLPSLTIEPDVSPSSTGFLSKTLLRSSPVPLAIKYPVGN